MYVVWGKVIFILGNVSLFTIGRGVPCPGQDGGGVTPSQVWVGGYPVPGLGRGYPIPGLDWGVPIPGLDGGGGTWSTPQPGLDGGGYPSQVWMVEGTWVWLSVILVIFFLLDTKI